MTRHTNSTVAIALATVATMFLISGCDAGTVGDTQPHPVAVRVVRAIQTDLREEVEYLGTIRSTSEITVFAQVQGTIVNLPVAEGDRVGPNEVIAEIDAPELDAAVERLQADHEYWHRRHSSDERLFTSSAISQEQLESSRRSSRSSSAALQETRSRLDKTTERSPLSGEMLKWYLEPGQHVMPGQPLVLVGSDEKEIEIEVPEEELRHGVTVGTSALFVTPSGDSLYSYVAEIAPLSSRVARTYTAKVSIPPSLSDQFRNGASVPVYLILKSSHSIVAVPEDAIRGTGDDAHVYIIKDRRALQRKIRVGTRQSHWVEIVGENVRPGDHVAVSNLHQLQDSVPVYPVSMEGSLQ